MVSLVVVATVVSFVVAMFVALTSVFVAGSAALFWARADVVMVMVPASNTNVENRILIPPVAVSALFDRSGMVAVVGMLSANAQQSNQTEQAEYVEDQIVVDSLSGLPTHGFSANSTALSVGFVLS
jgi:hypothetical protein